MKGTTVNFEIYVPKLFEKREFFSAGHRACQGCGEVLALRLLLKALGENAIIANATGCMEIISSAYPTTAWMLPYIHVAFENAAAVASGVEAAIKALRRKGKISDRYVKVVGVAGDGGTADIGFQALSGAVERGHDMMFVCLDNEAYMNTGIQRSSLTPFMAATTTSPAGKAIPGQRTDKKNMPEIMVAHKAAYVATACPSYPVDFVHKVQKAKRIKGPSYIHVLSVCPTGWRAASHEAVKLGRLAVETGIFPLYEVESGKYRITYEVPKRRPVEDYLKLQGRFRHLTPEHYRLIQEKVDKEFELLLSKVRYSKPW
ncbi:MAG: pyruvate synthase subunit PorB [Syntrophales bacterium]|nr:pyruvate synthase subunit PorB [Syntrophales bacterium]